MHFIKTRHSIAYSLHLSQSSGVSSETLRNITAHNVATLLNKVILMLHQSSSSHGCTAQFGPWPPLMGFRNAGLLVQRPTPNLEDQVSVFITPGDRVSQLYLRHWVPILVAFYDMHGLQWDYSLIPATTRDHVASTQKRILEFGQS
jgi:hypothetical protein